MATNERNGVALCLSGGGFRATLFHLGAVRRINELGLLTQVRSISSVSGGSLLAGFLATRLEWPTWRDHPGRVIPEDVWDLQISLPVRAFCQRNLRSAPLFANLFRFLPWNWTSPSAVERMAGMLKREFAGGLKDLPKQPEFIFCATDLNFGAPWTFRREGMGDFQVGHTEPEFSIAQAVAISACFPPIFLPYRLDTEEQVFSGGFASQENQQVAKANLRLNDGGNYDNFGVEPVWRDHSYLMVSDAGAGGKANPRIGWFQLARFMLVVNTQHRALRKRLMMDAFSRGEPAGAYWGVGSSVGRYAERLGPDEIPCGYSPEFSEQVLGRFRTDMDAFSPLECAVLENHGYAMADAAIQAYPPIQVHPPSPGPVAFKFPHPAFEDEAQLRSRLRHSHRLNPLGRGIRVVWPQIARGWVGGKD